MVEEGPPVSCFSFLFLCGLLPFLLGSHVSSKLSLKMIRFRFHLGVEDQAGLDGREGRAIGVDIVCVCVFEFDAGTGYTVRNTDDCLGIAFHSVDSSSSVSRMNWFVL